MLQIINISQALKSVVPGFENAKLRNFGMTIGNADPAHELPIRNAGQQEDHRQVQPHQRGCQKRGEVSTSCPAPMARFEDTIGIFPEFIDGYNILILPTTGRYFQVGREATV